MKYKHYFLHVSLFIISCTIITILPVARAWSETQEIQGLIENAKKEGTVNFYAGTSLEDSTLLAREFEKKYPFIKVEITRLPGEKLLTKALTEARAKQLKADVFLVSIVQTLQLKQSKLLMKYTAPESEAHQANLKDPEGYWNASYIIPYVITYNTKLISKQEAPKTYADLLDPKWKGKIGIETEEYQWFFHLQKIMGKEKGIDYMKRLSKQNLSFRKGHPLLVTLCAAGELPIVVVGYLYEVEKSKKNGAPVEWVHFEKSPYITAINTASVVASAPHPNAAKLFYNFILSREGAKVLVKRERIPARPEERSPEIRGLNLYVAFPDEFMANYKQIVKEWEEIFLHPGKS